MATFFSKFKKKTIPVIDWRFFASLKEGKESYNEENWPGWDINWIPIASNITGDAIIIYDNAIYEIEHGTGEAPRPNLVTKDIDAFEVFLQELKKYKGFSEEAPLAELREKIEFLKKLKKMAPRSRKYNFEIEINDIKDTISDIKYDNSKEGKFFNAAKELQKTALAELRKNGRYSNIKLLRRENKFVFFITGSLKKGETLEEIKNTISKYTLSYPIEYDHF